MPTVLLYCMGTLEQGSTNARVFGVRVEFVRFHNGDPVFRASMSDYERIVSWWCADGSLRYTLPDRR